MVSMSATYRYRVTCDGKTAGEHSPRRIADFTITATVSGTGQPIREARVAIAQGRRPGASEPTRTLDGGLGSQCELTCPKCRARVLFGVNLATDERIERLAQELDGVLTLRLLHAAIR